MTPSSQRRTLSGWGRTSPTAARWSRRASAALGDALDDVDERGILARGLGRSYGDAAQNAGGQVVELDDPPLIELDRDSGLLRVGSAQSLDSILRVVVPAGWFLPVTPGTRHVTIGGAIASDIHGKNHHVDGSFGSHVRQLSMLLANGETVTVGPERDPELFWATVGGMGLTGIVLDATVALTSVATAHCVVDTQRANDLDEVMALMERNDGRRRYSVAWIDVMARGRRLGRSVLTSGDHARVDQLSPSERDDPRREPRHRSLSVPVATPISLLNRTSVRAFNEWWWRRAPRRPRTEIQPYTRYFHPLDAIGSWNRLYGPRGFVQYQIVVPLDAVSTLRAIVERLAGSGAASFVPVLKRFGAANPAPLSFPMPGWTLTLDVPASTSGLAGLLHELDALVLDAGGRHYLAKDAHTSAAAIRRGYPRLDEWRAVRERVDPNHVWQSDLGRRLALID